jgi:hypothetical protein
MDLDAIAATRLMTTINSEALKLGYDIFLSIRSYKSSMVKLW